MCSNPIAMDDKHVRWLRAEIQHVDVTVMSHASNNVAHYSFAPL
jgi:hypothetical protein